MSASATLPKTMKAAQFSKPGGDLELVERPVPMPARGEVLLKVLACGVCHGEFAIKFGGMPNLAYPRIPGHEIVGEIVMLGEGVDPTIWQLGKRAGVGWYGGHCFQCGQCRKGDYTTCKTRHQHIMGIYRDGGYAEYVTVRHEGLVHIPTELSNEDAAPLLCAGLTMFNALRHMEASPGTVVGVVGIGGLGHLGIQFAKKMGYFTVAISNSDSKRALSLELGADAYIDASKEDVAAELQKLGGASVLLWTAPSARDISKYVDGLGVDGKLVLTGFGRDPITVNFPQMLSFRRSIVGWTSGHSGDAEDTLKFATQAKIHPFVEKFPLSKAQEAFNRMASNEVRFRAVIVPTME